MSPLNLTFKTTVADLRQLPGSRAEVAVVGRSNVGKSSLLNAVAGRRTLANVSGKPGRTQHLNVFEASDGTTIVDLPGYGYAASASKRTRASWQARMERYLLEREELTLALVLIDGEVGPTKLDLPLLAWLRYHEVPFQVVATKHDKVKSSQRRRRRRELAEACGMGESEVLWTSVQTGLGIERLRAVVRDALSVT